MMSVQEITRRVNLIQGTPDEEQIRQALEKRHWRGVRLEMDGNTYFIARGWTARNHLRSMGFEWNDVRKRWQTDSKAVAAKVIHKAKLSQEAKEAMKSILRLECSEETLNRAAARIRPSDVVACKERLTPEKAKALREAVGLLASCDDDKATVRNARGWSKAHTELGHTLDLLGIRTWTQAAVALRLCWTYRKQVPPHLLAVLFEGASQEDVAEQQDTVETEEARDYFTTDEADELVERHVHSPGETIAQIRRTPAYLAGQVIETVGFRFHQHTAQVVARVEGGGSVVLHRRRKEEWLEVRLPN